MSVPSRLFLSHRVAVRIGRLIAAWNNVELMMEGIIWALADLPWAKGRLITGPLQAHAKIKLVNGLIRHHAEADTVIPLWNIVTPLILTLQERRNEIGHAAWIRGPLGFYKIRTRSSNTDKPKMPNIKIDRAGADFSNITTEQMDEWIDQAFVIADHLGKIYVILVPSSPDTD